MNIPGTIRVGDTIKWRDDGSQDSLGNAITSGDWALTYYLRFNHNHEAHTATGTAYGTGWEFTISATDSAAFDAGTWYWQALATYGSEKVTLGSGQLTVKETLSYTGDASAYDGRSQAQQDLEAVQSAIRAIITNGVVKSYSIAGRNLQKYELADLIAVESKLKAEVQRERTADLIANGKGNPHNLFVRF